MLNQMFRDIIDEINGYVTTFVWDCENDGNAWPTQLFNRQAACSDPENYQPVFKLIVPPEIAVNPYTGAEMQPEMISYPSNAIAQHELKKWILSNVPSFATQLKTVEDWNDFNSEADINKVVLLSSKGKLPTIFSALTNHRKGKLRFGYVL